MKKYKLIIQALKDVLQIMDNSYDKQDIERDFKEKGLLSGLNDNESQLTPGGISFKTEVWQVKRNQANQRFNSLSRNLRGIQINRLRPVITTIVPMKNIRNLQGWMGKVVPKLIFIKI